VTSTHWDQVFTSKADVETSWHEAVPDESLALLDELGVGPEESVIDVGGGTATLVDHLIARGHRDLAMLDISAAALDRTRARLGDAADLVEWIAADITEWLPTRTYDVWHDRAVFHFLTTDKARQAYVRAMRAATTDSAALVIGTFADDGPTHCSSLPVSRYSPDELAAALGAGIRVVRTGRELHRTPWGSVQPFTWLAARRLAD
jgi:SAM-dependent methyltransferase